jgi:hypothetical protein
MKYEYIEKLNPRAFKRRFGVRKKTFQSMVKAIKSFRNINKRSNKGAKPALDIEAQVLVALEYWREYRTYFHIATSWGVSEPTICRIVHRVELELMQSGMFRLPGKKALLKGGLSQPEVVVMDVTETPIERPKRKQKEFYSGKKKRHTLKSQLIINQETGEIICTFFGKGRCHDFALFKASGVHFHPETQSLQDSGYQGINQFHSNSYTPRKKPKKRELSTLEKDYNRALAKERISIEHINRRLKIFKIFSDRYRNRRRRYGFRCNLLAAIYNYELNLAVQKSQTSTIT